MRQHIHALVMLVRLLWHCILLRFVRMSTWCNEHRRPNSTTSDIAKHMHPEQPEHSVELENTEILTTESRWFERGVKEAIYIRALNPILNRDGRR